MNNINTTENGYTNNVNLYNEMLSGKVEKKESFINFVEGLIDLYKEAQKMRKFIFTDAEKIFGFTYPEALCMEDWLAIGQHSKIEPYNDGQMFIAHYKAKRSIFKDLVNAKAEDRSIDDDELQRIVHSWDMWHYS